PRGTSFEKLLEAARPKLERIVPSISSNAQWLGADRVPRGLYCHVIQPHDLRDYVREYWKSDPMMEQGILANGLATTLGRSAPRKVIEQTPYWNDLVITMGIGQIIGASCKLPNGEFFQVAAHRPVGVPDFTDAELRRWTVAAAEVTRAVAALALREHETGDETCGVLVFDATGQLLHADEGAGPLFARLVARGH